MLKKAYTSVQIALNKQVHVAPLVVFRIVFGLMMSGAAIRFWSKGWIESLYIKPGFYFPYLGFEWIKPLGETGMYVAFACMAISAFFIAIGLFYRLSAIAFFMLFTYVELIDKTPYLNHYYFICLVSFLMCLLPANRFFAVDVYLKITKKTTYIKAWAPFVIKLQLALVYFFAGIAKIDYDWLIQAQPLRIWLPARADMPVWGGLLAQEWVAYVFSWIGMLFDVLVPFALFSNKYRPYAYFFVVVFHVLTWMLFNIGMFPFVMIGSTLIFFSSNFHMKIIGTIARLLRVPLAETSLSTQPIMHSSVFLRSFLVIYFIVQVLVPFRYLLYPGNLCWTEEGFRFSWRVMFIEKSGTCTFYVCNKNRTESIEINNRKYLTAFQEKMMCTQPDMILQFAHYLKEKFKGHKMIVHGKEYVLDNPKIYVDSFVSLNGRGSKRFIRPDVDLASQPQNLWHKTWILPFAE